MNLSRVNFDFLKLFFSERLNDRSEKGNRSLNADGRISGTAVPAGGYQLRKQHYTEHERDDKRPRAVIHKQEVAHLQIGMVAEQGGKLAQQCRPRKLRPRGRKRERERIGGEVSTSSCPGIRCSA